MKSPDGIKNFEDFLVKKKALFTEYSNDKIIESLGAEIIVSYQYYGTNKVALVFYNDYYFEIFYGSLIGFPGYSQSLVRAETLEDIKGIQDIFAEILNNNNRKETLLSLFQRLTFRSSSDSGWCSDSESARCKAYYILAKKVKELIERGHIK